MELYCIISTWWSRCDCKNSDLTLSFFLPSLDAFFCYSLLPYLLSENLISEYIILFLFLCHSSPYFSSLSFFGEFHLAVHVIKFCFFFFSLQHPELAMTWFHESRDCRDYHALLIPAHRRKYRASKGHCTFSGTHTISGPAAVISSSLALLIFPKITSIFLVVLLPLTLSFAHVFLFLFRLIDLHDLSFLRLFSLLSFVFPFQQQQQSLRDEILVHHRSHLGFLKYRR